VPGGYVETKKRDHSLGGILKVMAFVKKRTDIAGSIVRQTQYIKNGGCGA